MKKDFIFNAVIYILIFILSFSGIMLIYGSRLESQYGFGAADFAVRQFCYMLTGFILMDRIRRIDCRKLLSASPVLFAIGLIILWGVLFFGVKINGMRGWYSLYYFYIQPSELFKFIYVLFICRIFIQIENKEKAFLYAGAVSALWIGAVLLQPDYGTAVLYVLSLGIISFLAGVKMRILFLLPAAMASSLIIFIARKEYGFRRLYGFFSDNADITGSAWHWKQFQLTIARGGWFGNKTDGAFWSNNYLPFAYNDSAYAALHEITGFAGALCILLLFFTIFIIIYKHSFNMNYRFIILSGAGTVLAHALLHCSVNCALIPTTGLTLPFISYGGSSLAGMFMLYGVILSFCNTEKNNSCSH